MKRQMTAFDTLMEGERELAAKRRKQRIDAWGLQGRVLSLNLIYGMKSYITPKRIDFVVTQVTLNIWFQSLRV